MGHNWVDCVLQATIAYSVTLSKNSSQPKFICRYFCEPSKSKMSPITSEGISEEKIAVLSTVQYGGR